MSRLLLCALLLLGACSDSQRKISAATQKIDSIGIELEKNGIRGIEFFDTRLTLHKPILGLTACGERPCEYKKLALDSTGYPIAVFEDSMVSYDTKLQEFATELKARTPEKGRALVGIGIYPEANGKDIVGVVASILEKYSILPETVEVKIISQDSIKFPVNKKWRLLRDSVEFRHIVNVRIIRFVRK